MPHAPLVGVRINYRDTGPRNRLAPVVMLHGLAANQAFWRLELVQELAARRRVVTFDLRGHGYSERPPSGYDPRSMAGDLRGLLDHLQIDRAHLVGHSYGGLVALVAALADQSRAASLVLADSRLAGLAPQQALQLESDWGDLRARLQRSGVRLDDDEPEIGLCLLEAIASERWAAARGRAAQAAAFVPFGGPASGTNRAAAQWLRLLGETTAATDFRCRGGVTADAVGRLTLPVLAVYGARSPHRASALALVACRPDAHLTIVPGGGHFHPAAQPAGFAARLATFFDEIEPRG